VADQAAIQELLDSGVLVNSTNSKLAELLAYQDDSADDPRSANRKPYTTTDAGVAIIPISGVLMKEGGWMSSLSGCSSYSGIRSAIDAAMDDFSVRAILFDVNSPGGTTHGCFELSDHIHSLRGKKPMFAAANDLAASAAYALASAADRIFLTRTAAVGSIGVFAMHTDQSSQDEQCGLKYTYVYNGSHKIDGNPHAALSASARADIQTEVDREAEIFQSTVARNRNTSVKSIAGLEAALCFADSALPLLADAVGTFDDALAELTGKVSSVSATLRANGTPPPISAELSQVQGVTDMPAVANPAPAVAVTPPVSVAPPIPAVSPSAKRTNAETKRKEAAIAKHEADEAKRKSKMADDAAAEAEAKTCSACNGTGEVNGEPCEACKGTGEVDDNESASASTPSKTPPGEKPGDKKKDKEPDNDEDDMETKSAAQVTDMHAISELCMIAGKPELAAGFILDNKSLADVRKIMLDARASASAANPVNSSFGAVSTNALDTIQKQATVLAASGSGMSPSKALEAVLRANPALYESMEEERSAAMVTPSGRKQYLQSLAQRMPSLGLSSHIG
jgi:signal peptide peptidase SppA